MSRKTTIQNERESDPAGLGYTGDNVSDAALMNSLSTGRTKVVPFVNSATIYEGIVRSEYAALGATDQKIVDLILGLGEGISTGVGSKTRADLLAIFGPATITRANLIAAVTKTVSRGEELGVGKVYSRDFT